MKSIAIGTCLLVLAVFGTDADAGGSHTLIRATQADWFVVAHYGSASACDHAARVIAAREGFVAERARGHTLYISRVRRADGTLPQAVMSCDESGPDYWEAEIKAGRARRGTP
jgi:hypothetical protein